MGKRAKPEEVIAKLREIEIRLARGETAAAAARAVGVAEQSYYRWRKEYGGLQTNQVKRLKELEKESQRLHRAVSDLTLDNQILQEVVRGKCLSPLKLDHHHGAEQGRSPYEQPSRKLAPPFPAAREGHAQISPNAKSAKVRLNAFLSTQSFQSPEKPRKQSQVQIAKKRRPSRMARVSRHLRPAVSRNSETGSHSTDSTIILNAAWILINSTVCILIKFARGDLAWRIYFYPIVGMIDQKLR